MEKTNAQKDYEKWKLYRDLTDKLARYIYSFDWSYVYSDDEYNFNKGYNHECQIQRMIAELIEDFNEDPIEMELEWLSAIRQKFKDKDKNGDDLSHRKIKSWFAKYKIDKIVEQSNKLGDMLDNWCESYADESIQEDWWKMDLQQKLTTYILSKKKQ